jgi:hypothetical protein
MFSRRRESKAPKDPAASSVNTEVPKQFKSPLHRLKRHLNSSAESSSSSKGPESADEGPCDRVPQTTTSVVLSVPTNLFKQPSAEENKSKKNSQSVSGLTNVQSPINEQSPVSVHKTDDSQSLSEDSPRTLLGSVR